MFIPRFFQMQKIFIFIFFYFFTELCLGQDYYIEQEISISKPLAVSVDKNQILFVADDKGNIQQYNSKCEKILNFSPASNLANIQSLDAWQTVRVFLFYRDLQQFLILDRFLNLTASYTVPNDLIGFAHLISPSADNSLWILDNTDFSLKKYNPLTEQIVSNTALDLILNPRAYELNYIREYQNLVFLNDKLSGVLVFDNLGNYLKTIPQKGLNHISFLENELCFVVDSQAVIMDLYSQKERKMNLPTDRKWLFVLPFADKLFGLTEKSLCILKKS